MANPSQQAEVEAAEPDKPVEKEKQPEREETPDDPGCAMDGDDQLPCPVSDPDNDDKESDTYQGRQTIANVLPVMKRICDELFQKYGIVVVGCATDCAARAFQPAFTTRRRRWWRLQEGTR